MDSAQHKAWVLRVGGRNTSSMRMSQEGLSGKHLRFSLLNYKGHEVPAHVIMKRWQPVEEIQCKHPWIEKKQNNCHAYVA
jgi:hypothetical protein